MRRDVAVESYNITMIKFYDKPKLVFKKTEFPLTLECGVASYPGCFTVTGVHDHTKSLFDWCNAHKCGIIPEMTPDYPHLCHIRFDNEAQMTFFLLSWE